MLMHSFRYEKVLGVPKECVCKGHGDRSSQQVYPYVGRRKPRDAYHLQGAGNERQAYANMGAFLVDQCNNREVYAQFT
jgi:hypothetical protein